MHVRGPAGPRPPSLSPAGRASSAATPVSSSSTTATRYRGRRLREQHTRGVRPGGADRGPVRRRRLRAGPPGPARPVGGVRPALRGRRPALRRTQIRARVGRLARRVLRHQRGRHHRAAADHARTRRPPARVPPSCAVYGDAAAGLLDETTPVRPATPYASSKWICEQILADVCRHRPEYTVLCLRHLAVHTVAVRRVPPEEAAVMQPAHGPERATHPLVPGRQKAEPRHQQRRGVQGQGAVGLHEGTPAGVPALPAHLAVHLVPQGVPCAEGAVAAQQPPHPQGAVGGHPDHDLGVQDSSVNSTHLTPCTYGEKMYVYVVNI